MVWLRLTDQLPLERRHRALSDAAFRLLIGALCYNNRELADGQIDRNELGMAWPGADATKRAAAAEELERAGAIEPCGNGWRIVWHIDEQPTRAEVERQRAANRERQRRWHEARRESGGPQGAHRGKPTRPTAAPKPKPPKASDPVFTYWLEAMGKNPARSKLNDRRRAKLRDRRREGYTDEQLCRAIDGCLLSEFHMGANDRNKRYDDLVTILRDGPAVEAHIERVEAQPGSNGAAPSRPATERERLVVERDDPRTGPDRREEINDRLREIDAQPGQLRALDGGRP